MEICKNCLMPNTRPDTQFTDGVCQACINYESRKNIDWKNRLEELKSICDKHRSKDGSWDCLLPVSGGKDSYAMVYWLKEIMGMNPLLVTVGDPFTKTKAGLENYRNIGEVFNCDQILYNVSHDLSKRLIKVGFEEFLDPLRFIEQVLNTIPFKIAIKFGLKLMMKGESPFIYGGSTKEEKSALDRMNKNLYDFDINFWLKRGAKIEELNSIKPPAKEEMNKVNPEVYFTSYFVPWSSVSNFEIAQRYGFVDLTHEWKREGCMEDFEQIDSMAYLTHIWLKYPKFGFQRTSDIVGRRIRDGVLTRKKGRKLITNLDSKLDQLALKDFVDFLEYSKKEFWDIVEKFWNRDIFEKNTVSWKMKVDRFN